MTEETLFHEALAQPLAERAAFLDKACAGRPQLRAALQALLTAHEASGSLLDRPGEAPPHLVSTIDYRPRVEPGAVIAGRYTLVQKIGEGGMGEVWVAKQTEPVKRKVALKLIKAGLDSSDVVARFEQERQALALMDHPHIARVLDGGLTPAGQPFFVMELVDGLPLTKFCDQAKLSLRERLELFAAICQAVQHAHYKGIVHRDLKPANILVTLIDARPVPKVIDFGVAKATAGKLTDESLTTRFGALVGTLEYMSPEQTGFAGLDIDTRADIYALGVILYELLTGLRPIDAKRLRKAAYAEMIRIIQEEEPSKPSTRLSTAESLPSLAALRQTEPRKLMALLRGELDWVVLKCLEKQRERRYATANGLAADVQRYLADEPVEARPPSAGYRMRKFLKRHKGPVLAAGLLLLALVAGIAGTTWGLIRADRARAAEAERVGERDAALGKAEQEADRARRREADAKKSEANAVAARDDLEKANTKLTAAQAELLQSTDRLLSSVALSLLRPLAVQVRLKQPLPPLNDQEIEALWDLASSKDERLRLRFVAVALQDPASTRRLKDRVALALQAAVGLNGKLRTQVVELLGKRLQAQDLPPEQQVDVALCLAHLGILDRPLAAAAAATFTQAMSKTTDANVLWTLSWGLSAVAAHMEPKEAAQVCGQAAATLTQAMSKKDRNALGLLSQSLSAVAARLEPQEAIVTLTKAMSKTTDGYALQILTQGVSAVAARMKPKEAAATLSQVMSKAPSRNTLWILAQGLSAAAARMKPKEAAATLTQAMSKTTHPDALHSLAQGLSAMAARLEPQEAAAAAAILTQAMSAAPPYALKSLAQGLSAVAARLEPKEAAAATATLTQAMSKTTNPIALQYLAQGLSAVAARLESKEVAQVSSQAAGTLTEAMNKTTERYALWYLSQCLSVVAARLEPTEAVAILTQASSKTTDLYALRTLAQGLSAVAARLEPKKAAPVRGQAAATFIQAMSKMTEKTAPVAAQSLSQGLSAVAAHMEPQEAAQTAATLTQTMSKTTDPFALYSLAQGLSAVAARLEPKEAAQTCSQAAVTLTLALSKTTDWPPALWVPFSGVVGEETIGEEKISLSLPEGPTAPYALWYLAQGLSAVAAHLEPQEAARVCGQAAATLTQAMSKARHQSLLGYLGQGLSAVAARLEPKEATATLTQAMSKKDPNTLGTLAQSLSTVAARLEPQETAQTCSQAAVTLTQAMSKTTDPFALGSLAQGLSALAARLQPKEAVQVCGQAAATLILAMSKTADRDALGSLAQGLSALAARLQPKQAAVTLTQVISKTTDSYALHSLAPGLSAVTARLEPKEAAATLTQAMSKTTDLYALWILSRCLSAVAARLEPKEAAQACGQAAVTLTQAMSKTTDRSALGPLEQCLSAVAAGLEPKEAAEAVATLTQAMSKTTDPDALVPLAQGLLEVVARLESKEAAQACAHAAVILTQAMSKTTNPDALQNLARGLSAVLSRKPYAALAWAQLPLETARPPLPPQTLVDLLKQPFCVGEARRLVLAQLSRHHHRPFADQWEFVDYVRQHQLDLDLTTPPERPPGG